MIPKSGDMHEQRLQYEELLGQITWTPSGRGAANCPFCNGAKKISLYPGKEDENILWKCKRASCERGGTLRQLVSALNGNTSSLRRQHEPHSTHRLDIDYHVDLVGFVEQCHHRLLSDTESMAFLRDKRGVAMEVVEQFKIGIDARNGFILPAFDKAGNILSAKRFDPTKSKGGNTGRWLTLRGSVNLYGLDAFAIARREKKPLILCEGEHDVLAARSQGFRTAISTTGGATCVVDQSSFYGFDVVLALDNDAAGEAGTAKWIEALEGIATSIRVVQWPANRPSGHDIRDELQYYGVRSLQKCIKQAISTSSPEESVSWRTTTHCRLPKSLVADDTRYPLHHNSKRKSASNILSEKSYFKLNSTDKIVFGIIQNHTNNSGYTIRGLAYATISREANRARRTIIRAINRLEAAGWLKVIRTSSPYQHAANRYQCLIQSNKELMFGVTKMSPILSTDIGRGNRDSNEKSMDCTQARSDRTEAVDADPLLSATETSPVKSHLALSADVTGVSDVDSFETLRILHESVEQEAGDPHRRWRELQNAEFFGMKNEKPSRLRLHPRFRRAVRGRSP